MSVKPIPDGYHTITPCLVVQNVPQLIDFLKAAFQAQEIDRFARPDGTIMHAQVRIGDSMLMMGEAEGKWQPMPSSLCLYVQDADSVYRQALSAGGVSIMEPADQFYGDRSGGVKDPSGNMWWIATHKEDVAHDELQRRAMAQMAKGSCS